ncbi:MAG: hypothetical protein IJ716_13120 [Lachnospiraceae bacterium]|nr:hypothetical protein [Lachnospiraceae bacterium]
MKTKDFFKMAKLGSTECVGIGKGSDFHELKDDPENGEAVIAVGIEVRSGYILDAIGTLYDNGRTSLHGNLSGGSSHRIKFEEGDDLKSIEGRCDVNYAGNKTFSKVVIHTVNGKKYGPFGDADAGRKFKLEVPVGSKFVGLYGKADKISVNQLGITYVEAVLDNPASAVPPLAKPEMAPPPLGKPQR